MASKVVCAWGAVSLVAAFAACTGGYVEDPAGYCRQRPNEPGCVAPTGGQGGAAGATQQGQGGAPAMGSGGGPVAGGGGRGGGGGGGGLACEAPQIDCGGACADVGADAANCGECGYACGAGSTCAGGACAPVAVVSDVVAPYAFALDAANVYFAAPVKTQGAGGVALPIRRAPRAGGAATAVPFTGQPSFRSRALALFGGTLYFGDLEGGGALRKGPAAGGDVATHAPAQPAIQHATAHDGFVWWTTFDGTSRVRRAPLDASPVVVEDLTPPTPQFGQVPWLAIEGAGLNAVAYWVTREGSTDIDRGLWRRALAAGATGPEPLVEGGAMFQVALGPDGLYVADATVGIGRASRDVPQAALTPVISGDALGGLLQGLAVADDKLYWLVLGADDQLELRRSGLDGAGARVLGRVAAKDKEYWQQPLGPSAIVVDTDGVYFSDPGTIDGNTLPTNETLEGVTGAADGVIYRLPK